MVVKDGRGKKGFGLVAGSVFPITSLLLAANVDRHVALFNQACELIAVEEVHSVVGGASAAVRPRKITDTSAPGAAASGTVVEQCAALDLTATINTRVTGTLAGGAANRFAAGDRLAEDYSGTLTGLVGIVTYWFKTL